MSILAVMFTKIQLDDILHIYNYFVYIFLMFHIQRTSKAQALQSMKTVLPTPKSERLQQNRESDWTPGSYISQEEVSFATPPQPGKALMKINEGLEKNRKML